MRNVEYCTYYYVITEWHNTKIRKECVLGNDFSVFLLIAWLCLETVQIAIQISFFHWQYMNLVLQLYNIEGKEQGWKKYDITNSYHFTIP